MQCPSFPVSHVLCGAQSHNIMFAPRAVIRWHGGAFSSAQSTIEATE